MSVTGIEKVVIYDKDPFFEKLLKNIMWAFEVPNVLACKDLEEAWEYLVRGNIDCVIMDWDLDNDLPLTIIKDVRRGGSGINLETPIVVCSAFTEPHRLRAARDAGVDEIVSKPIDPDILLRKMLAAKYKRRPFIECPGYRGPDRRRRELPLKGRPDRRRKAGKSVELF